MGFGKCHLFFGCGIMKFFIISLLLLLLFDSPQGSSLPHRRSIGALNTTLHTNFNGTYERRNPCTNEEVETSSYIASHEFQHHTKEDTWSEYSHKCSAIISSFLQAIGNLIRFNNKQNGIFNFHVNTSISQKQDGHCDSIIHKSCDSLPTIIIKATGDEIPPGSSTENPLKIEQPWERKYSICGQSSDEEGKTGDVWTITALPPKVYFNQKEDSEISTTVPSSHSSTLASQGQNVLNSEDCPTTSQCQTTSFKDIPSLYPPEKQNFEREEILQNGDNLLTLDDVLLTTIQTPKSVPPLALRLTSMGIATPDKTSPAVFNRPTTSEPEQKSDICEISPTPMFNPNVPNAFTLRPEDESFTPYEPLPPITLENPSKSAITYPEKPELLNPISSSPTPFNDGTEFNIPRTTSNQPFYYSTEDFNQKPITRNNEEQLIQNQYQPLLVGGEEPQTVDPRQPFYDNLGGREPESQQSANLFTPAEEVPNTLPPNQADVAFEDPNPVEKPLNYPNQVFPNFGGTTISPEQFQNHNDFSTMRPERPNFYTPGSEPNPISYNTEQNMANINEKLFNTPVVSTQPPITPEPISPTVSDLVITPKTELPYPDPAFDYNNASFSSTFQEITTPKIQPPQSLIILESATTNSELFHTTPEQSTENVEIDQFPSTTAETPIPSEFQEVNFKPKLGPSDEYLSDGSTQIPDPTTYNQQTPSPFVQSEQHLTTKALFTNIPTTPSPQYFIGTVNKGQTMSATAPDIKYPHRTTNFNGQEIDYTTVQPESVFQSDDPFNPFLTILPPDQHPIGDNEFGQPPASPTIYETENVTQLQTTQGPEFQAPLGNPDINNQEIPYSGVEFQPQFSTNKPFNAFSSTLLPEQMPIGDYEIPQASTSPLPYECETTIPEFQTTPGPEFQNPLGMPNLNDKEITYSTFKPEEQFLSHETFNQFPSALSTDYQILQPPTSPLPYGEETVNPQLKTSPEAKFLPPLGMTDLNNQEDGYTTFQPQPELLTNESFNAIPSTMLTEKQPIGDYDILQPPTTSLPYADETMTQQLQTIPESEFLSPLGITDHNNQKVAYSTAQPEPEVLSNEPFNHMPASLTSDNEIVQPSSSPLPYIDKTVFPQLQTTPGLEFQSPFGNADGVEFEPKLPTNDPFNAFPSTLSPEQQPIGDYEIPQALTSPTMYQDETVTPLLSTSPGPEFQTPLGIPDINNQEIPYSGAEFESELSTNDPFNAFPSTPSPDQQPIGDYEISQAPTSPPTDECETTTQEFQTAPGAEFQNPLGMPNINDKEITYSTFKPEEQFLRDETFNQFPSTLSSEQQPVGDYEIPPTPTTPLTYEYETTIPEWQTTTGPEYRSPQKGGVLSDETFNQFPSAPSTYQQVIGDYEIPQASTSPTMYEDETVTSQLQTTPGPEFQTPLGNPDINNQEIPYGGVEFQPELSTNKPFNAFSSTLSPDQQPIGDYEIPQATTSPPTHEYETTIPELQTTPGHEFQTPLGIPDINNQEIPYNTAGTQPQLLSDDAVNQFPSAFSSDQTPIADYEILQPSTSSLPYDDETVSPQLQTTPGLEFQTPLGNPNVNNQEMPLSGVKFDAEFPNNDSFNAFPSTLSPDQQPIGDYEIPQALTSPNMYEGETVTPLLPTTPGPEFQSPFGNTDGIEFEPKLPTNDAFNAFPSTLSPDQQPIGDYEIPQAPTSPPPYEYETTIPELQSTPGTEFQTQLGIPDFNNQEITDGGVEFEPEISTDEPFNPFPSTPSSEQERTGDYEIPLPTTSPTICEDEAVSPLWPTTAAPEFQSPLGIPGFKTQEIPYSGFEFESQEPFNPSLSSLSPDHRLIGEYEIQQPSTSPTTYEEATTIPQLQTTAGPGLQPPLGMPNLTNNDIPHGGVQFGPQLPTNKPFNPFPSITLPKQQPTREYDILQPPTSSLPYVEETVSPLLQSTPEFLSPFRMNEVNNYETAYTTAQPEIELSTSEPFNTFPSTLSPEQQPIGDYEIPQAPTSPPTYEYETTMPELQTTPGPEFLSPLGMPDINKQEIASSTLQPEPEVLGDETFNQFPLGLSTDKDSVADYEILQPPTTSLPYGDETETPQTAPKPEFVSPLGSPEANNQEVAYTTFQPEPELLGQEPFNPFPSTILPQQQTTGEYEILEPSNSSLPYEDETVSPQLQTTPGPEFHSSLGIPDTNNQEFAYSTLQPEQNVLSDENFNQFPSVLSADQQLIGDNEIPQDTTSPTMYDDETMIPHTTLGQELQSPFGMPVPNNQEVAYSTARPDPALLGDEPFIPFPSTLLPEQQPIKDYDTLQPPTSSLPHEDENVLPQLQSTPRPEFQSPFGNADVNNKEMPLSGVKFDAELPTNDPFNPFPSNLSPDQQSIGDYEIPQAPTSPYPYDYETTIPELQTTPGPEFQTPPGVPDVNNQKIAYTTHQPEGRVFSDEIFNQFPSALSTDQQLIGDYEIPQAPTSPTMYEDETVTPLLPTTPGTEFQSSFGIPYLENQEIPFSGVEFEPELSTNEPFKAFPSTLSPDQQPIGDYEIPQALTSPTIYDDETVLPKLQTTSKPEFLSPLGITDLNNQEVAYSTVQPEPEVLSNEPFNHMPASLTSDNEIVQPSSSPLPYEDKTVLPQLQTTPGPEFQSPFGNVDGVEFEPKLPANDPFNAFPSTLSPDQGDYEIPQALTSPTMYEDETVTPLLPTTPGPEFQTPLGIPDVNNQEIPYGGVEFEPVLSTSEPFSAFPSTLSPDQQPIGDYEIPQALTSPTMYEDETVTPLLPTTPGPEFQSPYPKNQGIPFSGVRFDPELSTNEPFNQFPSAVLPEQQPIGDYEIPQPSGNATSNQFPTTLSLEQKPLGYYEIAQASTSAPTYEDQNMTLPFQTTPGPVSLTSLYANLYDNDQKTGPFPSTVVNRQSPSLFVNPTTQPSVTSQAPSFFNQNSDGSLVPPSLSVSEDPSTSAQYSNIYSSIGPNEYQTTQQPQFVDDGKKVETEIPSVEPVSDQPSISFTTAKRYPTYAPLPDPTGTPQYSFLPGSGPKGDSLIYHQLDQRPNTVGPYTVDDFSRPNQTGFSSNPFLQDRNENFPDGQPMLNLESSNSDYSRDGDETTFPEQTFDPRVTKFSYERSPQTTSHIPLNQQLSTAKMFKEPPTPTQMQLEESFATSDQLSTGTISGTMYGTISPATDPTIFDNYTSTSPTPFMTSNRGTSGQDPNQFTENPNEDFTSRQKTTFFEPTAYTVSPPQSITPIYDQQLYYRTQAESEESPAFLPEGTQPSTPVANSSPRSEPQGEEISAPEVQTPEQLPYLGIRTTTSPSEPQSNNKDRTSNEYQPTVIPAAVAEGPHYPKEMSNFNSSIENSVTFSPQSMAPQFTPTESSSDSIVTGQPINSPKMQIDTYPTSQQNLKSFVQDNTTMFPTSLAPEPQPQKTLDYTTEIPDYRTTDSQNQTSNTFDNSSPFFQPEAFTINGSFSATTVRPTYKNVPGNTNARPDHSLLEAQPEPIPILGYPETDNRPDLAFGNPAPEPITNGVTLPPFQTPNPTVASYQTFSSPATQTTEAPVNLNNKSIIALSEPSETMPVQETSELLDNISPQFQPSTTVKHDEGTTLTPEFGPTRAVNYQQFSSSFPEIPDRGTQYLPMREPHSTPLPKAHQLDPVDIRYTTTPGQEIEYPPSLVFQPQDQVPSTAPFNNQQTQPTDQLLQQNPPSNPSFYGQLSSTAPPEYLNGTSEYQTPETQAPLLDYSPQISDAKSPTSQTEKPNIEGKPITSYDQPSTLLPEQPVIETSGEIVRTSPQVTEPQSVDYIKQPGDYSKPEPEIFENQNTFNGSQPTPEVHYESNQNSNIGGDKPDFFVSLPPTFQQTTPSDISSQIPPFETSSDSNNVHHGTMPSYQTQLPTLAPERQTTEPPHFASFSTYGPLNSRLESKPKIAQGNLTTDFPATYTPDDTQFPNPDELLITDNNRSETSKGNVTPILQPHGYTEISSNPDQLDRYNVRNRPDSQLTFGGTTTPQYLENMKDQKIETPLPINTTERPELDQQQIVLETPVSPNYADYDQGFSTRPPKLAEYGETTVNFTPRDPPTTDRPQFVNEGPNDQQLGTTQRETDSPLGFDFEERSPPNSELPTYPPPQQNQRSNPLLQTVESQVHFPLWPQKQNAASSFPEPVSLDPSEMSSTPLSFEPQNQNGLSTVPPYYPGGDFKRNFVTSQPIVNTAQDVTNTPLMRTFDSQALVSDLTPTPSNKPDRTTTGRFGYMSSPLRNP